MVENALPATSRAVQANIFARGQSSKISRRGAYLPGARDASSSNSFQAPSALVVALAGRFT